MEFESYEVYYSVSFLFCVSFARFFLQDCKDQHFATTFDNLNPGRHYNIYARYTVSIFGHESDVEVIKVQTMTSDGKWWRSMFKSSSVARGGGGEARAPHWLVKYAKSHVFGAFEADFLWKIKNSPPHRKTASPLTFEFPNLAEKSVSILVKTFFFFFLETTWFLEKKPLNFRFRPKNQSQFRWRRFFLFFCFWRQLILGGNNLWISEVSEKFRLNFRTNLVKLIQEQWKFGSRSFALFSLFQNSPPPLFQILATRLFKSNVNSPTSSGPNSKT